MSRQDASGELKHGAAPGSPGRWPALDGLRALAILVVMACHLDYAQTAGGSYGVDLFFVLSGFLITALLVGEYDTRSTIRLGYFYARRALRLFPALVATILFAIVLAESGAIPGWLSPARGETVTGAGYVLAYVGNWARALGWNQLGLLGHTWSLGIEEQFYLLWPPVLFLLLRRKVDRRALAVLLVAAALAETAYRFALIHHGFGPARVHNGLDSHSDGLMWGAAIALGLPQRAGTTGAGPAHGRGRRQLWQAGTLAGFAVLGAVMWAYSGSDARSQEYGLTFAAMGTAAVLAGLLMDPIRWVERVLSAPPMQWIGKRSYGLYLWHYPIFVVFLRPSLSRPVQAALMLPLSFAAAALSYRYLELPFLRLKDRFSRSSLESPAMATSSAGTALQPSSAV